MDFMSKNEKAAELAGLPSTARSALDDFLRLSSRCDNDAEAATDEIADALALKESLAKLPRH